MLGLDTRDDVLDFSFFSPSTPEKHSCGACTAPNEHFPTLGLHRSFAHFLLFLSISEPPLSAKKIYAN